MPGHTRQFEVSVGLVKLGWQVELFASDFNLVLRKYLKPKKLFHLYENVRNVDVHWLWVIPYKKNNWLRILNWVSFSTHIAIRLIPYGIYLKIIKKAPDVIVYSSPQLPAAWISLIISKILNIPFVAEIRDLWPQVLIDQAGISEDKFLVRILKLMEYSIYKNANHVIVLANGSQKYVREKGCKNVSWLPNGPDLKQFTYSEQKLHEEYFKLVYFGAHGEANSLETLIQAARILETQQIYKYGRKIFIDLVGDGPEKQSLIREAKGLNNLKFFDPVSKYFVPNLISEANAVIVTLKNINLYSYGVSPNKLYDAYAIGRPVITAISGAINDEVEIEGIGLTALSEDPKGLAKVIFKISNLDHKTLNEMGMKARKLAEKRYSRQLVIDKYNSILNSLIEKKLSLESEKL